MLKFEKSLALAAAGFLLQGDHGRSEALQTGAQQAKAAAAHSIAYFVDEADKAGLISKNTFGGKGMSSDPLFNMAAQLLAADLNVNTGDTPSSTAQNAINQAQALLVKYGWNGNSYSPKLTGADAALANSLNTILDKFNNNQI